MLTDAPLNHETGLDYQKEAMMKMTLATAAVALALMSSDVQAQTDLSAYADANGYLDVQNLTCAQLAGTWQEDADKLMVWYSGWYNGLAKKHHFHISRGERLEHEVIVHCKAHPQIRVIDAIAVVLKDERAARGIEMNDERCAISANLTCTYWRPR